MATKQPEIVAKVLDDLSEDRKAHDVFVEKADRCYRAYRGIIERRSESAQFTVKQHPAIVLQSLETMAANLLPPNPKWRLRALPTMGSPDEMERVRQGARANELLLSHQLTVDNYAGKQRTFDLQGLITGLTASKQSWLYRKGERKRLQSYQKPILGYMGEELGMLDATREVSEPGVLHDNPTFEPIDVRHLIFHQGAASLAKCERVTHRCFYPYSKLKELEAQGYYGKQAGGQSLSELKETRGNAHEHFEREVSLHQTQPHKDDIEVLEQWREGGKRVVTVANQSVLLADKPNPFWFDHLEHPYPFVVCSGTPDLFTIPGISEVELMAELQEMLWTLINQRLTNLQLVNNAIFLIAEDVEDPDSFEFAPGERWLVPRPVEDTIKSWSPDVKSAEISLNAENLIRGDVQNITGGMPFLSGTDSGQIDQQTATGVSIVTSLAQKRLAAKQQQFIWAKAKIGEQWCALNQQYVRSPRLVPVIGTGGVSAFEEIRPDLLQGDYVFEVEMADESLIRSEKRAEATALFQLAAASAGVFAAVQQPLNMRAFAEVVLDAYDITDKDKFFSATPQVPPPQPGQAGQQGGANGAGPGNNTPTLPTGQQSTSK